jgi:hypothetical protein
LPSNTNRAAARASVLRDEARQYDS